MHSTNKDRRSVLLFDRSLTHPKRAERTNETDGERRRYFIEYTWFLRKRPIEWEWHYLEDVHEDNDPFEQRRWTKSA